MLKQWALKHISKLIIQKKKRKKKINKQNQEHFLIQQYDIAANKHWYQA